MVANDTLLIEEENFEHILEQLLNLSSLHTQKSLHRPWQLAIKHFLCETEMKEDGIIAHSERKSASVELLDIGSLHKNCIFLSLTSGSSLDSSSAHCQVYSQCLYFFGFVCLLFIIPIFEEQIIFLYLLSGQRII